MQGRQGTQGPGSGGREPPAWILSAPTSTALRLWAKKTAEPLPLPEHEAALPSPPQDPTNAQGTSCRSGIHAAGPLFGLKAPSPPSLSRFVTRERCHHHPARQRDPDPSPAQAAALPRDLCTRAHHHHKARTTPPPQNFKHCPKHSTKSKDNTGPGWSHNGRGQCRGGGGGTDPADIKGHSPCPRAKGVHPHRPCH